jgi:hypothetical protein
MRRYQVAADSENDPGTSEKESERTKNQKIITLLLA